MESSRLFEQLGQYWQKLPQQQLSKLTAVALVIYCAHLLSDIIWQWVPVSSDKGQMSPIIASQSSSSKSSGSSQLSVNSLLSLNLFGTVEKAPAKPKPVVQQTSAPKTRLNVTLVGLVADSTSNTSKTSVAIIESSAGQNTYGVSEKVDGTSATVYQIFIDRVILLVSGRYETLMLDGIEYSTSIPGAANEMKDDLTEKANQQQVKQPTVQRPTVKTRSSEKSQRVDKRTDVELSQSLRKQREEMFSDPKKLMDYIRIRPERRNGELKGYRLSPGKDPSLFTQVGLKRNDLAVNINGYDLTDMQQALTVMRELKTMTEANITVMRNDSPVEIILAL